MTFAPDQVGAPQDHGQPPLPALKLPAYEHSVVLLPEDRE
jgi:hypothetical protein